MTLLGKSTIAITAIGAVGGAGAYASGLFNSKEEKPKIIKVTYKNKLINEGFKVLDTSQNSNDWDEVLKVYKTATTKSFTESREENKTQEQLRGDCERMLNKEVEENNDYSLLSRWCVKKEKMNTILSNGKRKLLNFGDETVSTETEHWKNKIQELKKNEEKFSAVKLQKGATGDTLSADITAFKKGCQGLQTDSLHNTDDNFEANFKLAKEWCTIKVS